MRLALLVVASLSFCAGCHTPQGIRGYVVEGGSPGVCTRDASEEEVPDLPEGRPVAGALVIVEVKGKAGGWVPFGAYKARTQCKTDGLGRFDLSWYEVPHPQEARLRVEKPGYVPLVWEFYLPTFTEVRVRVVRE